MSRAPNSPLSQAGNARLTQLLHERVRALNDAPEKPENGFVLLWLQGQRRLGQNLAFAHAQRRANELNRPLVVYEALKFNYPHASDRFHRFVLEGAADNAREAASRGVAYRFFLERPDSPRGVLHALAARSCLAVTDWLPTFIHPEQTRAFARRAPVRVELVDAAGIAPLAISEKVEIGARTLRPKLHKRLDELLCEIPEIPARVAAPRNLDWGFDESSLESDAQLDALIAGLPIDHTVAPVRALRGGRASAQQRLAAFLKRDLKGYAERRNEPSLSQTSWLSPFLHFGHLGAIEIALAVRAANAPEVDRASFLEELIVRRELAFNFCTREPRHQSIEALPAWARATLSLHESDPRPVLLDDRALENAESPDEIWNAAQRQLVAEGRIHGYLRMLWGKLLLTWSRDANEALRRMRTLNDKYALDGRDACSDSNFLWCLGLHDRPFPERAIYGTVRSMTSRSTRSKFDLDDYLSRWGSGAQSEKRAAQLTLE